VGLTKYACNSDLSMSVKVRTLNVTLNANQMRHARQIRMCSSVKHRPGCWMRDSVCEHGIHGRSGIQSAFRRVAHQRPRRRRRRRVYFGPYRNNPDNNGIGNGHGLRNGRASAAASAFRQPSSTCRTARFRLNTYRRQAFSVAGPMA